MIRHGDMHDMTHLTHIHPIASAGTSVAARYACPLRGAHTWLLSADELHLNEEQSFDPRPALAGRRAG